MVHFHRLRVELNLAEKSLLRIEVDVLSFQTWRVKIKACVFFIMKIEFAV